MWYNILSGYYSKGFYTNDQMKIFVKAGYITDIQYKEITGIEFVI